MLWHSFASKTCFIQTYIGIFRMSHYYVPYFTGQFLNIKISKNVRMSTYCKAIFYKI